MYRRNQIVASLFGLTLVASLWGFAVWVLVTHDDRSCYTFGYAHGESWLMGVVVHPDGYVFCGLYDQNLTLHDGFYAKLSRTTARHYFTLATVIPHRLRRTQSSPGTGVMFHLGLPLLVFFIWSGCLIIFPILRARARRKRGLCLACGYDMRGATSPRCTECGSVNSLPSPNLPESTGIT